MTSDQESKERNQDPMHGVTLKMVVTELMEHYGWEELAKRIDIKCFKSNPSINSSLKFLRKTPWARQKVERLYLRMKWLSDNGIGSAD
ncbi:MAG: DNA-binding protein VF530 [Methylomarinum sp.]|nr:DNA-binding protein VF530 [Methylomarinum sp.]